MIARNVPGYSGGTATDFHRLPYRTESYYSIISEKHSRIGHGVNTLIAGLGTLKGRVKSLKLIALGGGSGVKKFCQILEIFLIQFVSLRRFTDGNIVSTIFHFIKCMLGQKRWDDLVIGPEDS